MMTGEQFLRNRKRYGLTQRSVAEKLGISQAMISFYERNLTPIPRDVETKTRALWRMIRDNYSVVLAALKRRPKAPKRKARRA